MLLDAYPEATIRAVDVSAAYLDVLRERLAGPVAVGRVVPDLVDADHGGLLRRLRTVDWVDRVDCVCAFDSLVHVDLQYMMGYLLTAAEVLRIGGVLAIMVADATSAAGFEKLVRDVRRVWPFQGRICQKFEWVGPDILANILSRLGFEERLHRSHGATLHVVASLREHVKLSW
jgi:hypothetical protein